jgi:hypothetical protein
VTSPAADCRIDAAARALHNASWVGEVEWPCSDSSHIDGTCTEWYRELASAALQAADGVDRVANGGAIALLERLEAAERALGGDQGTAHAGESVHIPALGEWTSLATAMGVPECTDSGCWHHEGAAS